MRQLRLYSASISEDMESAKDELTKEAVKELKQQSPKSPGPSGGEYAASWTRSIKKGRYIVHVEAPEYRLTHLLEKGHAIANGTGRFPGRVPEREHIGPVEEKVVREYIERVERAARQ